MAASSDALQQVRDLNNTELTQLTKDIEKIKQIRLFKKRFDARKPHEFLISAIDWVESDDPIFDKSNMIIGELSFLVGVSTMDNYCRDPVKIRNVLNQRDEYEDQKHEKTQSKWIYSRGEDLEWIDKFLKENLDFVKAQMDCTDIDWFFTKGDHDDPIVGSFELTVCVLQKRPSLMDLKKLGTFSLISTCGKEIEGNKYYAKKNGIYSNKELRVSKEEWDNENLYFYVPKN